MKAFNARLRAVEQLLYHLREARSGESEGLMKEAWEDCPRSRYAEIDAELDEAITFFEGRAFALSQP